MNLSLKKYRCLRESGFTMVEIALCLAIVAFAMVVIMGVLPLGGVVQKKNREKTLCQMDGNYLLEAIRNGAQGYDDLGLYVDEILFFERPNMAPRIVENNVPGGVYWGTKEIVGLVSAPDFLLTSSNVWIPNYLNNQALFGNRYTNLTCRLKMRSMNGTAADKNMNNRDFGMTYLVDFKIVPAQTNYVNLDVINGDPAQKDLLMRERTLSRTAYDVAVTLSWPVTRTSELQGYYKAGPYSQTFRTLVSGTLSDTQKSMVIPGIGTQDMLMWYFNPREFSITNSTGFYDKYAN